MKKNKISEIQSKILIFILEEVQTKGYPPSVREISEAVGRSSTSTIHLHLKKLEDMGYIKRNSAKPRAIEILKTIDGKLFDNTINYALNHTTKYESASHEEDTGSPTPDNTVMVPVVGEIAAGQPILAQERIEDYYPMPMSFIGNYDYFILKVRGDSMINAGILEGDYLLIQQQNTAENGQIVAALLDDSATVKRFYAENNTIRLQPENDFMSPIYTTNVEILGIVKAVMRKIQ